MIVYLSGTGNTRYVAKTLSTLLDEKLYTLTHINPAEIDFEGNFLLFVCPIYSWGIPPVVADFIKYLSSSFVDTIREKRTKIGLICTCGDEIGLSVEMFIKILEKQNLVLSGAWSIIMPNNYVLLPGFDTDSREIELEKLERAPERVKAIADEILDGNWKIDVVKGKMSWLKTRLIYPLFKKWGMFPSRWHWTSECIECGKCEKVCPTGNIRIMGGHPKWMNNCISCVACYHNCPVHAIEYGNATDKKGQYVCPLK